MSQTELAHAWIKKQAMKIKCDNQKTAPLWLETIRTDNIELAQALVETGLSGTGTFEQ